MFLQRNDIHRLLRLPRNGHKASMVYR